MLASSATVSPASRTSNVQAVYCLPVDDLRDRLLIATMIAQYSGVPWRPVTQSQAAARYGCWVSPAQPSILLLRDEEVVVVLIGRMSSFELRRAVDGFLSVR